MTIEPCKLEYHLEVLNHTMKAVALHQKDGRKMSFYFDEKLVSERMVPDGDIFTDDECINNLVVEYSKKNVGVFADIFKNHSNKVKLLAKVMEVKIVNYGLEVLAKVTVEKNQYIMELSANEGKDKFLGTFSSGSFSDALEKLRIFTSLLEGVNVDLTNNISELSSDKVEEWIKWAE